MDKEMTIVWFDCNKELPYDDEKVLIVYDGEIKTARFEQGLSINDRIKMGKGKLFDPFEWGWRNNTGYMQCRRSEIIKSCDEWGNNLVPYCWDVDGNSIFGQRVKHWARFPNIEVKGEMEK